MGRYFPNLSSPCSSSLSLPPTVKLQIHINHISPPLTLLNFVQLLESHIYFMFCWVLDQMPAQIHLLVHRTVGQIYPWSS
ncbi:hypothetical protein DSO57_1029574, partial [Entomophthora muscae]